MGMAFGRRWLDTREPKIVVVGSSLAGGWPATMNSQLTAAGKTNTVVNHGHGSYSIKHAGGPGTLFGLVATEVDPELDASKACVLSLEGVTNDLYYGATAAQCVQYVKDYIDELAGVWPYVVLTTPTPRTNPGTPPGFESERQDFIAAVNSDPTFGGRVHAICALGSDSRMADTTNDFYYNADLVHYSDMGKGLYASLMLDQIRALLPAVNDSACLLPYPCPWLARDAGLLNGSGAAPSNGDAIASWTPVLAIESTGAYAQATAGNRPTYDAANTALDVAADDRLVSASSFGTYTRHTIGFRAKFSAAGGLLSMHNAGADVRVYTDQGEGTFALYSSDGTNHSVKTASAGTFANDWHTYVIVCDGTHAGHKLYVDGVEVGLTTYIAYNGNPVGAGNAVHYLFGSSGSNGVTGKIKSFFRSPVPFDSSQLARLRTFLES